MEAMIFCSTVLCDLLDPLQAVCWERRCYRWGQRHNALGVCFGDTAGSDKRSLHLLNAALIARRHSCEHMIQPVWHALLLTAAWEFQRCGYPGTLKTV